MRSILAMLAVLLVAGLASGQNQIGPSPKPVSGGMEWRYSFASTDTAGVYLIGNSAPSTSIGFELGVGFSGILYSCDAKVADPATDTDTCDVVQSLTADVAQTVYRKKPNRKVFLIDINTAETAGSVSTLGLNGSYTELSSAAGLEGTLAEMNAYNATAGQTWIRNDAPNAAVNCSAAVVGVEANDVLCMYTGGGVWAEAGLAGGTDNLGTGAGNVDIDISSGANDVIVASGSLVDTRDVSADGADLDKMCDSWIQIGATDAYACMAFTDGTNDYSSLNYIKIDPDRTAGLNPMIGDDISAAITACIDNGSVLNMDRNGTNRIGCRIVVASGRYSETAPSRFGAFGLTLVGSGSYGNIHIDMSGSEVYNAIPAPDELATTIGTDRGSTADTCNEAVWGRLVITNLADDTLTMDDSYTGGGTSTAANFCNGIDWEAGYAMWTIGGPAGDTFRNLTFDLPEFIGDGSNADNRHLRQRLLVVSNVRGNVAPNDDGGTHDIILNGGGGYTTVASGGSIALDIGGPNGGQGVPAATVAGLSENITVNGFNYDNNDDSGPGIWVRNASEVTLVSTHAGHGGFIRFGEDIASEQLPQGVTWISPQIGGADTATNFQLLSGHLTGIGLHVRGDVGDTGDLARIGGAVAPGVFFNSDGAMWEAANGNDAQVWLGNIKSWTQDGGRAFTADGHTAALYMFRADVGADINHLDVRNMRIEGNGDAANLVYLVDRTTTSDVNVCFEGVGQCPLTAYGPLAIGDTREVFGSGDTTPDVGTGSWWLTNATAVTISDFDGAARNAGQYLNVKSNGATVYDCNPGTLIKCGSTDITTAAGDVTTWTWNGTEWDLIAFMDQSTDMGTDGGGGAMATDSIWAAVGDIAYADGVGTGTVLTAGALNTVLTSGGAGVAPSWGAAGSGTLTGDGTATYVPYYSAAQVMTSEAALNYTAGTNTLVVGTVAATTLTGAGSGITAVDAATVDTLEGASFAQVSGDTYTGTLTGTSWAMTDAGALTAVSITVDPSAAPSVVMEKITTGTQGGMAITSETGTGATADGVTAFQTDVAGTLVSFAEADGVTETFDILKRLVIQSSAAPALTVEGEIEIDNTGDATTITTGVLNYRDDAGELFLFGVDAYPAADNYIMKYDAGTNKVVWEADAGATFTPNADPGVDHSGLAGGNGIVETAGAISIDLNATSDGVGATSNESGMEFATTDKLSLLQGCANTEILKFNTTGNLWECAADSGAAGGDSISIDSVAVVDPDFVSTGDIDFVDTANTVTANINANTIVEAQLSATVSAQDKDFLQYNSAGVNFAWRDATQTTSDLSLTIGTNTQAWDAELDTIAALTETNGGVIFAAGGAWTTDTTPALDGTDFVANSIPTTALLTEVRSMYWGAGAMEVDGTGCTTPTAVALVAGGPTPLTIACADSDTATISGSTVMPDSWDGGTVVFNMDVGQIAASTGTYAIHFEGQCVTTGDATGFLAFAGTGEQIATLTLIDAASYLSDDTPSVTLNGTSCAGGDVLVWRGAVNAATMVTSSETLAVIVGVKMEYLSNIGD